MDFIELLGVILNESNNLGKKINIFEGDIYEEDDVIEIKRILDELDFAVKGLRGKLNDTVLDNLDHNIYVLGLKVDFSYDGEDELELRHKEIENRAGINCIHRIIEIVNELVK
ncbi:hypothetical protein [Clostridium chrysemydis]|uniref:hypothetical protein n=1 Tax=Clostridium chrysemydis TaxID=2665504 RepID=UPI0018834091|nr:hypothetical protein [Clostridium chrysemydis]